jgi:hypothetical protein
MSTDFTPPMNLKRALKKALILFIIYFLFCHQVESKEKFGYLEGFVGKHKNVQELFSKDESIKKGIEDLARDQIVDLYRNLSTSGPIDMISGDLVFSGNAPHKGGEEMGIIVIELYNGNIHAAIYSNSTTYIFSDKKKFKYLPVALKKWIYLVNSDYYKNKKAPPNISWNR